jgi:hypothetical protein
MMKPSELLNDTKLRGIAVMNDLKRIGRSYIRFETPQ